MIEIEKSADVKFWCDQIETYEREFEQWQNRSKKIVKRYKDERPDKERSRAQFNILWSNVQTLLPALYAKNPVPNVDRRFQDDDKLGTISAQILERAVTYFVDTDEFGDVMRQVALDRLLPGRGTAWVRYELKDESALLTDDEESEQGEGYSEDVEVDHVHWEDFGHTWGRTWQEVRAVWRKVYLGRDQLEKRFPDAKDVPLDFTPSKDEKKISDSDKKATVYEIWDKTTKTVFWIHKEYGDVLDKRADPLKLKKFFPCPKPVYSTIANDSLIPSPDYTQYQDQAKELDDLTGRINSITKSLKVAGVYDAKAQGVQRLLQENVENQLIPVEQWAVFGDKGGLAGVIGFLPMKEIVEVLISLYEAREKVKQDLYEVTGLSDIIRGATDAGETATAQQIKGKFATLRLDSMAGDVARFARDLVRLMAEIIAEHFSPETIKQISGVKLMTEQEKQQVMMQQQMQAQQIGPDGQPMQAHPIPEEIQEMLDLPSWEQVTQLLGDDTMRCFRIGIETDSTIKADQEAEKQARVELLSAVAPFIEKAVMAPLDLQPLLAEMLMFGIRGFKVGRDMESTFEVALKKIKQSAENPAPPPPNPEEMKLQAQMQIEGQKLQAQAQSEGQKMQMEGQKVQTDAQIKQSQIQLDTEKAKAEISIKNRELDIKEAELRIKEAELQIRQQEIAINTQLEGEKLNFEKETAGKADETERMKAQIDGGAYIDPAVIKKFEEMQEKETIRENSIKEMIAGIMDAISRPKKVIRGKDGKISEVQ